MGEWVAIQWHRDCSCAELTSSIQQLSVLPRMFSMETKIVAASWKQSILHPFYTWGSKVHRGKVTGDLKPLGAWRR